MFGPLSNLLCQDFNLTMPNEAMLPEKSFTYASDAHNKMLMTRGNLDSRRQEWVT